MINKNWAFCVCDFETTGISNESFPIEVGCIWTDYKFNVLNTYESLVKWTALADNSLAKNCWINEELSAFKIHNISYEHYKFFSLPVKDVVNKIKMINSNILEKYKRIILISDNAKFESFHMQKMYDSVTEKWDFHYCTWDTNLLLEGCGVGDPKPAHRAFADAALLHTNIVRSLERIGYYSSIKE